MRLEFSASLITAGASESWITGRMNPKTGDHVFSAFLTRFTKGGVWLWDESTATDPNLAMLVNNALDNGFFEYAGQMFKRHEDFICIASDNTVGLGGSMVFTGRNRLDGSTRERFRRWFEVDYDTSIETAMLSNEGQRKALWALRAEIRKRNAPVFVSTRRFQDVQAFAPLGLSWEELVRTVICPGWSQELTTLALSFNPDKTTALPASAAGDINF
jgi:cobaltochelatase CobS